jgi:hypothetical protein
VRKRLGDGFDTVKGHHAWGKFSDPPRLFVKKIRVAYVYQRHSRFGGPAGGSGKAGRIPPKRRPHRSPGAAYGRQ